MIKKSEAGLDREKEWDKVSLGHCYAAVMWETQARNKNMAHFITFGKHASHG